MYYTGKAFQTIIITNFPNDCMKFLNFLKKDKKVHNGLQTKSFQGSYHGGLHDFLMGSAFGGVTPTIAMDFYRSSASLAHAVDLIAKEIEKIKPVLELPDGTLDPNADILKLLKNPNGYEGSDEFIGQVSRHFLLTHDSVVYAEGAISRPPIDIWSVKPQTVTVQPNNDDGYPQEFLVNSGHGRGNFSRMTDNRKAGWRFLSGNLRQVYNIAGFSSRSTNVRADSPLEAICTEINQQISGRTYNLALINNGGRMSLVAVFNEQLSDDQLAARSQALNESLAGPRKAGTIGVITSEDVKFQEMSINNKDMDYLNLDDVARKAIYNRYEIPLPLVDTAASTLNNLEQSVFHFFDMAVLPNFQRIYSGLGKMLLPRYDLDSATHRITYNTNDIESLRTRKIEELGKLMKDRVITTNQYRESLGKEPEQGGDVIYQNATLVPMGETFTLDDAGARGDGK